MPLTAFNRPMFQKSHNGSRLNVCLWKTVKSDPDLGIRANVLARMPTAHRESREQVFEGHLIRKSDLVLGLFLGPSSDSLCPGTSRDGASGLHAGRHSQPTCLLSSSFPLQQLTAPRTASNHRVIVPLPALPGALLYQCFAHSGPERISENVRNYTPLI